jgi:serine/threonine-protein kinase
MDSTRWDQIQELFHHVVDLPTREGYARLSRECKDDPSLIGEVLKLIEEDTKSGGMSDRGPAQAAYEILAAKSGSIPDELQFGPYRILRLLGERGMGTVYLAKREDLGNPVAIKFLRDPLFSPARRERFQDEQRMLAQLNHRIGPKVPASQPGAGACGKLGSPGDHGPDYFVYLEACRRTK